MDAIAHKKLRLFGDWWDPEISWRRKYKNGDPDQGERYLFSKTILSWTTDGWHFFQMCFHTCWQIAVSINFDYVSFFVEENLRVLSNLQGGGVIVLTEMFVFIEVLNASTLYSVLMNLLFVKLFFGVPFEYMYKKISELGANIKPIM